MKKKWEDRFDKEFPKIDFGDNPEKYVYPYIKPFIQKELNQARKEERIKKYKCCEKELKALKDDIENIKNKVRQHQGTCKYDSCYEDVQNLIDDIIKQLSEDK